MKYVKEVEMENNLKMWYSPVAMVQSILVVEDEEGVREYLRELLLENGFSVQIASTGAKALKLAEKINPDLVLLDLNLPDISGETVCTEIKETMPETAIIMLTARDSVSDIVQGLNLGADDYIKKPFTSEELLARIKTRLRAQNELNTTLEVGDLKLDTKKFQVTRNTKEIELTPQEFRLLEYLMSNQGQVLTREMILNKIWMYSPDIETRVVDVYIGYLRKKIDSGQTNKLIHSVRGFGYVVKEDK